MTYQQKLHELRKEIVARITEITDRPEDWLPHTVYVEEEGVDNDGLGIPVYTPYKLLDFLPDGECQLLNVITNEVEDNRNLSEIEIDWLVTVLNYYGDLSGNHIEADKPKELLAFVYPIEMDRGSSDQELLELWKKGEIRTYTPAEFASLLNDEMFDELHNWVKFIEV